MAVLLLFFLSGATALIYEVLWSKHLALSYYSKPPFIAYAQWLGTHLFGDTEAGVRFVAPTVSALAGWVLLRYVRGLTNARTSFFFLLAVCATPLLSVGSILMTIDPLAVLFWVEIGRAHV